MRSPRWRELAAYLLLPPLAILLVALNTQRGIGIRYVLVVPMFLAVAAGAVTQLRFPRRNALILVLLGSTAASVWLIRPSYLAYVNEAFGGTHHAHRIVTGPDIDWGQDLRRLGFYRDEHYPSERIQVVYYGTARPESYGLTSHDLYGVPLRTLGSPETLKPGLVAISATALNGFGYGERLKRLEAIDSIGSSILLFRVP